MEDRDIWMSAQQMIKLHAEDAASQANLCALKLIDAHDFLGAAVWRRVANLIGELERQERLDTEDVN